MCYRVRRSTITTNYNYKCVILIKTCNFNNILRVLLSKIYIVKDKGKGMCFSNNFKTINAKFGHNYFVQPNQDSIGQNFDFWIK